MYFVASPYNHQQHRIHLLTRNGHIQVTYLTTTCQRFKTTQLQLSCIIQNILQIGDSKVNTKVRITIVHEIKKRKSKCGNKGDHTWWWGCISNLHGLSSTRLICISWMFPFIICLILMNYLMEFYFIGFVNAHLPGCFCPWTFRLNIGLNTSPSDSFVSYLNSHLGYSAGEFQALQLIVLAVFGAVD